MIYKETWYREALEKEIQRQFKDLPEGEEKLEQAIRVYMRVGQLPPGIKETEVINYLVPMLFSNIAETPFSGKVNPEYYIIFWKLLWDFIANGGGLGRLPDLKGNLQSVLLETPLQYRPKVSVEVSLYERDLDYTSLNPSLESALGPEASEIYWDTPWVFVSRGTKNLSLLTILRTFPKMGRNPEPSGETPYVYYTEKPTWWDETEALRDLLMKGLPPIVHQKKVEFDLSYLPGNWPQTILQGWRHP